MQQYSGKAQESPPFTTHLLSFFQSFCLCSFKVAIVEHVNECLELLGAIFCSKLDVLFYLVFDPELSRRIRTEALRFRASELSLVMTAI